MKMSKKYCYLFSEGNANMRELLGGKGANLAEMTNIALPVPQGFTITTEACTQYYEDDRTINAEIQDEIMVYMRKLEQMTGKKFGDMNNPLLVSVRSGARASMPGMMDTILNLGLNDQVVEAFAKKTKNPRFAYDSYRRFIQMYSDVVMEEAQRLAQEQQRKKEAEASVAQTPSAEQNSNATHQSVNKNNGEDSEFAVTAQSSKGNKKQSVKTKDSAPTTSGKQQRKRKENKKDKKEEVASAVTTDTKTVPTEYADARKRIPRSEKAISTKEQTQSSAPAAMDFAQMKGSLPMPVSGTFKVTSRFGQQNLPDLPDVVYDNPGIDARVSPGANALAVFNGKVSGVYMLPGYNNVIIVNHGSYYTVYGNISAPAVKVGDNVRAGQGLGKLAPDEDDNSHSSIHFEVWKNREKLNPLEWIRI